PESNARAARRYWAESEIRARHSDQEDLKSTALVDIEAKIEDRGAVGDPTRGDQVDSGGGDLRRGLAGDAARRLGHGAAGHHLDGAAQGRRVHIVEQDRVDAMLQGLGELVERIDFEFDLDKMAGLGAGAFEPRPDAAGPRD